MAISAIVGIRFWLKISMSLISISSNIISAAMKATRASVGSKFSSILIGMYASMLLGLYMLCALVVAEVALSLLLLHNEVSFLFSNV